MRLIDADAVIDKMRDAFDMQDLYLPIHFKQFVIDDMPTVCDIDAIRKRIRYEANVLDTTKGFAYCSGWMDAFKFALDIIDKHMKGEPDEMDR